MKATDAPFDRLDWLDDTTPREATLNMALDEVLAETAPRPTLRTYGWVRPSISFGYFGSYQEAIAAGPGADVVRRATGGGMVVHGDDFTYALAIPRRNGSLESDPQTVYRRVHERIARVLNASGYAVGLAPDARATASCFAGWSRDDLLMGGKKIGGAAQRRTRFGLLLQGSLQAVALPEAFKARFAASLAVQVATRAWDAAEIERATRLASIRYAAEFWMKRRA
jgi:lipoate-protein ligase A